MQFVVTFINISITSWNSKNDIRSCSSLRLNSISWMSTRFPANSSTSISCDLRMRSASCVVANSMFHPRMNARTPCQILNTQAPAQNLEIHTHTPYIRSTPAHRSHLNPNALPAPPRLRSATASPCSSPAAPPAPLTVADIRIARDSQIPGNGRLRRPPRAYTGHAIHDITTECSPSVDRRLHRPHARTDTVIRLPPPPLHLREAQ
jgi:hypothetical protein